MKAIFATYPELLFIDTAYKLSNLRMPVFIQLIIDGNGESKIVSVFVVSTEHSDTLESLLNIFKENNPAWTEIKIVLSDKDFTERSVYGRAFPLA